MIGDTEISGRAIPQQLFFRLHNFINAAVRQLVLPFTDDTCKWLCSDTLRGVISFCLIVTALWMCPEASCTGMPVYIPGYCGLYRLVAG